MIVYTDSKTDKELTQIIALQKENLAQNLTPLEVENQGFVTVIHSLEGLREMNDYAHHIIIKNEENVVGYVLAMTQKSKADIPVLIPLFNLFEELKFKNKHIADYNYIVAGQVCIHKNYRGQGLLDECYVFYKNYFKSRYDFVITEIASNNLRSLHAHQRIGFVKIHQYVDDFDTEWCVVIWDWLE